MNLHTEINNAAPFFCMTLCGPDRSDTPQYLALVLVMRKERRNGAPFCISSTFVEIRGVKRMAGKAALS